MNYSSQIPDFYKLSMKEKRKILKDRTKLEDSEIKKMEKFGALGEKNSDSMSENVVGSYELPLGIATNLEVNGKDYLVPMAIEESSVVAACSYASKLARKGGGVKAESSKPFLVGQIQLNGVKDFKEAKKKIMGEKEDILKKANKKDEVLVKHGGGAKELEVRNIPKENTIVVHLTVDVRDAYGANAVDTMVEGISPKLEEISGGKANLRIVTNLADKRIVNAEVEIPSSALEREDLDFSGEKIVDMIVDAYEFAEADPYRAVTHNKGIMNGIDAVTIATGNDFRAVESGAHSYASRKGSYKPLTTWEKTEEGNLKGKIEVPVPVGTVGGATKIHPMAQISVDLLGVETGSELSEVIASVGLVQNLAALRALASEGIQRGHMRLHAKNIAKQAGATGKKVEKVARMMIEEDKISQKRAEEILREI